MASVWDLYLDADDATRLFEAVITLERHRWVREPLPLDDAVALRERLRTIARIAGEDAVYWAGEAADRHEAAQVDGGRWGSPTFARRMSETAEALSVGSQQVEQAAHEVAEELAARLAGR